MISFNVTFHTCPKVGLVPTLTAFKPLDLIMYGLSVYCHALGLLRLKLTSLTLKNVATFQCIFAMVESNVTLQVHLFETLVITVIARMFLRLL